MVWHLLGGLRYSARGDGEAGGAGGGRGGGGGLGVKGLLVDEVEVVVVVFCRC